MTSWLSTLFNYRLRTVLILGFASGLPLSLSGSTLQAWYAISQVDIATIGFLSLVGQPYVFKFLWAPLLDHFSPQFNSNFVNNRRKFWILLSQFLLIIIIVLMSFQSPEKSPILLGFMALMLAFASATQDIAIDAYRTDTLKPEERGLGAALSVGGYRVAMLVSGGLALILADYIGWQLALFIMAGLLILSAIITFFAPQPIYQADAPKTLQAAIVDPFKEFWTRPSLKPTLTGNQLNHPKHINKIQNKALWILLFIIIYKLGDAFAGTLSTTFLIRGLDFSLTEIGLATKTVGLAATLFGVFLGGLLLYKRGVYQSLMWFGIFQAITNLGFVVLASGSKSFIAMVIVIAMENLAGGMGTAAFVAFLMGLCHHQYSATQFALFSALSAVARVYVGPMAGYGVEFLDWQYFFFVTFLFALPGLFLLKVLKSEISSLDKSQSS